MIEQNMHSIQERIMTARRAKGDGRSAFTAEIDPGQHRRRWSHLLLAPATGAVLLTGAIVSYQFPVLVQDAASTTVPKPAAKPAAQNSQAQQPQTETQQQAESAAEAAHDQQATTDPFAKHAADAGLKTCAATYAGLGKALTGGTQYMVQTQTAKADADHHALQGIVGMTFQSSTDANYSGPAAGVVLAAPTGKGCEGNMVRIVPFTQTCEAAASFLPKGSQPLQPLSGIAVYALATGGQAMLLPSGEGCVAISIVRVGS